MPQYINHKITWLFVQGKNKKNGRQFNTTVSQDKTFPQIRPFSKPEAAAKKYPKCYKQKKKKKMQVAIINFS